MTLKMNKKYPIYAGRPSTQCLIIQEPARKTSPKPPWNYGAGGTMGRGVFQVGGDYQDQDDDDIIRIMIFS